MTQTPQSGSIGAGQFTPLDGNSDFTVAAFIVRQIMAELDTMKPCKVVAVHPGSGSPPAPGTVDVQLLVSLLDGAGNAVQQGIVYGVPYWRFQFGPWAIVADPAKDNVGFIVCADRDISALANSVANGSAAGIVNPGSLRKYSVSDGIYVGGCFNPVPAATLWLKPDGSFVLTDKSGNVLQGTASGISATPAGGGAFIVNGPLQLGGAIQAIGGGTYTGDIKTSGAVEAGVGGGDHVTLQGHKHGTGTAAAGTTVPTPGF